MAKSKTTGRSPKTAKRKTTAKKKPAKKKHKLDAKAMKRIVKAAAKRGIVKAK